MYVMSVIILYEKFIVPIVNYNYNCDDDYETKLEEKTRTFLS